MENDKLQITKYKQNTSHKGRFFRQRGFCGLFFVMCLLFVICNLWFVLPVQACSCIRGTPEQYFNDADVVFTGKVLEIEQNWDNEFEVKFEVIERQKLSGTDKTVVVRTALTGAECGYNFQPDVIYVVYALRDGSRLYTDLCSGNHKHYGR